jgi:hypothetical protein
MKKIMFSDKYGLTEAVLTGCKTMTRRIIPPIEINWARRGKVTLPVSGYRHRALWMDCRQFLPDSSPFDYVAPQKYQPAYDFDEEVAIAQPYKTLIEQGYLCREIDGWVNEKYIVSAGYQNKMFVAAEYMPHRIRITDIKVERLLDISEEDCLREGIVKTDCVAPYGFPVGNGKWKNYRTPQDAFACLIDKVSGTGTWNRNT